jgi:hypothetical protein
MTRRRGFSVQNPQPGGRGQTTGWNSEPELVKTLAMVGAYTGPGPVVHDGDFGYMKDCHCEDFEKNRTGTVGSGGGCPVKAG